MSKKSLSEMCSLNEKGYEILTVNLRCACLVPQEKSKELSSILKKDAETTNIIDATHHPVIVAAAVVPIRVLRNENDGEIIDSFEIVPNTEKIWVSLCIYVSLKT